MAEDLLRILGVASVGLILILPSDKYLDILSENNTQVIVGMVVLAVLLFIDAVFGALLGLAVLIWFFKMNHRTLLHKSWIHEEKKANIMEPLYGSNKNLEDVQNNVVDPSMMDQEMIGFETVYGEPVIGAQGLDKTMPGFDDSGASYLAPL